MKTAELIADLKESLPYQSRGNPEGSSCGKAVLKAIAYLESLKEQPIRITIHQLDDLLKTDIWPAAVESVGANGYETGRKNLIRGIYRKLAEKGDMV